MTYSADCNKTRSGRVTFFALATALALLLMPMQATPAEAGPFRGALGGALIGGIFGVPILGAVVGGMRGAARDRRRSRNRYYYRGRMNRRSRRYRR